MATKTTKYLVGERWKDAHGKGTHYLGWISTDGSAWGWANGRKEAVRFDSKADAVKAADLWRSNIISKGYPAKGTAIMTDPSGPDCSYHPA